jgi:hypothetical protein
MLDARFKKHFLARKEKIFRKQNTIEKVSNATFYLKDIE